MLSQTLKDDLAALAQMWVTSHPRIMPRNDEAPGVPQQLLERITRREPYASRAIEDARLSLSIAIPHGIGLEVAVPEPLLSEPFEAWPQSLRDVQITAHWAHDMSGQQTESYNLHIARIGLEEGQWRIIVVMNDDERSLTIAQLDMFRAWRKK